MASSSTPCRHKVEMKMMPYIHRLLLLFLISCFPTLILSNKSKSVSIVLDAKWKSTSLLLEASEYLSDENEKIFWQFVDLISSQNKEIYTKTEQEIYDVTIAEIEKILPAPKISLLKFYLSLRYYSPKIEMFQQIALDRQLPDCESIVDVNGLLTCDVDKIVELISSSTDKKYSDIFKVDHRYPSSSSSNLNLVILYGEIGSKSFSEMHQEIKKIANTQDISYYVRHYVKRQSDKKVRLSGYGVELAIKSTEYKAQDDTKVQGDDGGKNEDQEDSTPISGFVFSTLKKNHRDQEKDLDSFKNYLLESSSELTPLKKWELQSISIQAAKKILSAPKDDALNVMMDIAQNFPTRARSLVKVKVDEDLKKEISRNENSFSYNHQISVGDSAIFINGIQYDLEQTDIYTLAGVLRVEANSMNALHSLGLKDDILKNVMKLDLKPKENWAIDIRDTAVTYVNDIENDSKYRNWHNSLNSLLQMFHFGMLSNIRKNIFHMVIIADPSKQEYKFLYKMAESFYVHNAPVRIGLVFAVNPDMSFDGYHDAGVAILNAYNFISNDKTPYDGLSFITDVYLSNTNKDVEVEDVISLFKKRYKDEDFDLIFGSDSDYDTGRKLAWHFINKTGMNEFPKVIINGVPLEQKKVTESDFEEAALMEVIQQQQKIARAVSQGKLSDNDDVLDWLMNKGHVLPRINKKIITNDEATFLDFSGNAAPANNLDEFQSLSMADMTASIFSKFQYMTGKDDDVYRPNTIVVVSDLESQDGQALLETTYDHMFSTNSVRLGILHNPKDLNNLRITKLVESAASVLSSKSLKSFFRKLFKGSNLADYAADKISFDDLFSSSDVAKVKNFHENNVDEIIKIKQHFCKVVLNLKSGHKMIIADGKAIAPFESGLEISSDDLNLLEKYSSQVYSESIAKHIQKLDIAPNEQSDMALKVSAILMSQTNDQKRTDLVYSSDKLSALKIPPQDDKRPAIDINVVVDPLSRGAQKVSALINVLKEVVNANIKIFLNCQDKLSDLPLKSFYRYVLEPEPLFTPQDGNILGPGARFTKMPTAPLFTLAMMTSDNWMVEAVQSTYDLDNIHLKDVNSVVYAEFELEYILLEGHCFEQTTGSPPRGLQFTLGNQNNPVMVDTIVMANLGYFQLKASPGAWILKLRQGRSNEIYDIASHENTDSPLGSTDVLATISSFESKVIKIRVSKKSGKEHKEILDDDSEEESGLWNSITSSFSSEKQEVDEDDGVINIFSLASGHLYERFLRIMMLSVLKNTKSPVKFWFLKNFLSPTVKDFLPHMAKEYGFEYELVQYKWPRWLHQQTEKQRIIWGYKILFLDVLFPLDVKKIIFVDADQVVRADMKELINLDLDGAPYGYTPFCDSRKDMDGYRFWKSGYWSNHLGYRKYHISALYVVDLKKFRQVAAGDRLRGQYHGLSQDPNSLSNLDQDLPNNMIHQVKIKSLPQHWLWCETWCDDASKKEAKTIDLCNNPKTKEPKLVSAMRIISEWKDYDQEIKALQDRILNNITRDEKQGVPVTKKNREEL